MVLLKFNLVSATGWKTLFYGCGQIKEVEIYCEFDRFRNHYNPHSAGRPAGTGSLGVNLLHGSTCAGCNHGNGRLHGEPGVSRGRALPCMGRRLPPSALGGQGIGGGRRCSIQA